MASLEGNKILAAVLLGTTVFVTANIVTSDFLFGEHGHFEAAAHYPVAEGAAEEGAQVAEADTGPEPISPMLASADVAAGEEYFSKKCTACHVNEAGAKLKSAPNLWGVVGRNLASTDYPKYSAAFKERADQTWGYEELSLFLTKPKGYISGTAMAFAGVKDKDRADLIAYLRTLSDNPMALPMAEATTAAVETPAVEAPAASEGEAASN
jgi:cytochrome c